ncbi:AMP-binding protein [Mycobacterium sp. CBMA271]|uniref:long-chain-fatty-acid--CoA ligase n=1 Tax=unclassified Mycobacteroides TaxID=2618759 RepID=UPI00132C5726|nr:MULTISPECIES: long-chain-fatty-acid--CoA ligase [unclassified Mycobacteroides]MUM21215.1 AMP-binding protein [Mycobacteroides sp. CBMA 271]
MGSPEDATVTQLLLDLADVDDRGLHFEGSFTSWREHVAESRRLASVLRSRLDPSKPPHIGVLLENTPTFSYLLGAAALGGLVLVGLNPTRRGSALQRDVDLADCQLILTDSASASLLDGVEYIDIDSLAREYRASVSEIDVQPDGVECRRPCGSDLFMLIFTSGTSGDPKAVQITHGKVASAGIMLSSRFGLDTADVCYLSMPMFHSNAVLAGWSVAVASGASIALRRKFSASGFLDDVRKYGATYANYVGKPMSYVLATPEQADDAENTLKIMYGNEAAAGDTDRFAKRFGAFVVDGFGSTEGGVALGWAPGTPSGAIGPLTPDVRILDVETGDPCPPATFDASGKVLNAADATGELVNVTGPGRFTGYYKNPEADAERMAGGMYHSGDLAYADENGYVYFAGRLGDWLRVDGENLGTAPIERALLRHPGITEVAVYGIPDPTVGDRVMAAIVGAEFDPARLGEFLAAQEDLGPKQWPSFVRISTDLPRTATFKVIKRQLSAEALDTSDPLWELSGDTYLPR